LPCLADGRVATRNGRHSAAREPAELLALRAISEGRRTSWTKKSTRQLVDLANAGGGTGKPAIIELKR